MTTNFYVPPQHVSGDRLTLPEEEARHASKVLRVTAGEEITVVDGAGGWYRVKLDHVDRQSVVGHVVERREGVGEPSYHLTIAMALVKQRARFETFLEKAVELGVSEVVPIMSERTQKERIRFDRLESKLIAAMKQCGRSRLVRLHDQTDFEDYLASSRDDLRLCCQKGAGPENHVLRVLRDSPLPKAVSVLIGPEGGFTDAEAEYAASEGWKLVSLAPRRLRAETAAMAAAAVVAFVYDSV